MTGESVGAAVAQRAERPEVEKRVTSHADWFGTISPSHMPAQQLVQLAIAQYRKDATLKEAADKNPGSFMVAVAECARLGLVPGDTFHLVGFRDKNAPNGMAVVGMTDYTGEIELAYRSGEVESIHYEVVRAKDFFRWNPTTMRIPVHEIPANEHGQEGLGGQDDRGPLTGVYAYARLRDGAISQCIVLDRWEIAKHRDVAKTEKFWGPPWPKEGPWTPAMWIKTAIHALEKAIPTSPEYMTSKLRAEAAAAETMPAEIEQAYARQDADAGVEPPALGSGNGSNGDSGGAGPRPHPRTIRGRVESSQARPGPQPRQQAMGQLRDLLAEAGLGGDEHRETRRVLIGVLANPDGEPLDLKSPADMNTGQATTAVATLRKALDMAAEQGADPKTALENIARRASGQEPQ